MEDNRSTIESLLSPPSIVGANLHEQRRRRTEPVRKCMPLELASSQCCRAGCLIDQSLGWVSDARSKRPCVGPPGAMQPMPTRTSESLLAARPSFCGPDSPEPPTEPASSAATIQFFGEFGYEIDGVIPHAYYLHRRGLLNCTRSVAGMEPFYYFSPCHESVPNQRRHPSGNFARYRIFYGSHQGILPHIMHSPPYAAVYRNSRYVWSKPTLVIHNKDDARRRTPGEGAIALATLQRLFTILRHNHQIVYVRPRASNIVDDGLSGDTSHSKETWIIQRDHPQVLLLQDLIAQSQSTYNEVLLRVHANARRFISVQGGSARLASFFGGTNLIFHHIGRMQHEGRYDSYAHYHWFSNANISVAFTADELCEHATRLFTV